MSTLKVNNVIINNGDREFSKNEIENDFNLSNVVNRAVVFKGIATLLDQINTENATLYILSDSEYSVRKIEILNASEELYKEFWNKTK